MEYQQIPAKGREGYYVRTSTKKTPFVAIILMAGFIGGIIYANIVSRKYTMTAGIFDEVILKQYLETEIIAEDYLWYVIRMRLLPFLTICILGCSKWKKILVGAIICWTGFAGGMLAVLAVLNLGLKGLLLCIFGILPQAFCYVPAYIVLFIYLFRFPSGRWTVTKTVFLTFSFIAGILLETYVNPVFLRIVIKIF